MLKKYILCFVVGFCLLFFEKTTAQNIPRREFRCSSAITNIATTPLGNGLVAAYGSRLDVFHIRTNINLRSFDQHTGNITALTVHPTLNRCVSADASGEIFAWNTNDLSQVVHYQKAAGEPVVIRFAPDGNKFYVLLNNRTTLLEYTQNEPAPSATYTITQSIDANWESRKGATFFATSKMDIVRFQLENNTLTVAKKWKGNKKGLLGIKCVNGKLYSIEEKKVTLWDDEQKPIQSYESKEALSDFALNTTEKLIALGTTTGKISVLETESKKMIFQNIEQSAVKQVVFHPSEPLVIVRFEDGSVKTWVLR